MDYNDNGERKDATKAPRRNNYFYGKLLDELHFRMEQEYINKKRWLMNRLSLGEGVLCGLQVEADNGKVCVKPGVAIDAHGREIVVPHTTCIDPWQLTDECGKKAGELSKDEAHTIHICLAYHECTADYVPVLVTDCNTKESCAPGTIVEGFHLLVREGEPVPPPELITPDVCEVLFGGDDDAPMSPVERFRKLCEYLSGACPEPPEKSCIILATVKLTSDGTIGEINTCTYRKVVYSNAMLLKLILCLAERIEECCSAITPPAPPETPFNVRVIEFINADGAVIHRMTRGDDPTVTTSFKLGAGIKSIQVTFSSDVNGDTIIYGSPPFLNAETFSFLVQSGRSEFSWQCVPGEIAIKNGNIVQFTYTGSSDALRDIFPEGNFPEGEYTVTLYGDPDQSVGRPAIAAINNVRLDGEPNALPSGDGTEGGNFVLKFEIVSDE